MFSLCNYVSLSFLFVPSRLLHWSFVAFCAIHHVGYLRLIVVVLFVVVTRLSQVVSRVFRAVTRACLVSSGVNLGLSGLL